MAHTPLYIVHHHCPRKYVEKLELSGITVKSGKWCKYSRKTVNVPKKLNPDISHNPAFLFLRVYLGEINISTQRFIHSHSSFTRNNLPWKWVAK